MTSRRKRQRVSIHGGDVITAIDDEDADKIDGEHIATELNPADKKQQRRSLFVHSLSANTTTESLTHHFSQDYALKHATVVTDPATKQSKGYGFVTFADTEDAQSAREAFDGSLFEGRKIKVELAEPRQRDIDVAEQSGRRRSRPSAAFADAKEERSRQRSEGRKPPKLIVRNLPWTVKKPEQLAAMFMSYGKVKHATIPKSKPGLLPGFGFVVMRGMKNAGKALEGMNGKKLDGRTLAVDWAVEKDIWETLQKYDQNKNLDARETVEAVEPEHSESVKSEDDDAAVLDEMSSSDDEFEDLSDVIESQSSGDHDAKDGVAFTRNDTSSTLFLRNLPFTATDETLHEHFASFGPLRYARVVLDQVTERPKGTGFICFYSQEDADTCLHDAPRPQVAPGHMNGGKKGASSLSMKQSLLEDVHADRSGHFTLDGRVLQVSRAVDRNEAARLTISSSSVRNLRDKDKRRLYLLSEGTIASNAPLYDQLAPAELKMREDSAKQRQTLIRTNPSLHLSLTRLSVRNIHRNVTSKDLKALAREAVVGFAKDVKAGRRQQLSREELSRGGDTAREAEKNRKAKGKGIVKQAKIVFEGREGGKVVEGSGAGRSRGYGFIEYVSHRWALMGLRWLNGHVVDHQIDDGEGRRLLMADAREKKKRLVVEFAIENAQVVERRQERELKARERSKFIVEQREQGKAPEAPKKTLSRNALLAKTRKGGKRKREDIATSTQNATDAQSSGARRGEADKLAKRQQIIAKKRMIRKSRRKTMTA
ncbi:RNA recognition motif-containing protein [Toensbergia leucococca]|nr:RNA recognition motif-containing protein [Toensbergia leucococca]